MSDTPSPAVPDRRLVLVSGITLLACLGSVYAWSFFTKPLIAAYGWSNLQTSMVFSLAVAGLGLSAAVAGPLVSKVGSRKLALVSAGCYTTGYLLSALALHLGSHALMCLGYGVIGGIGLGTGYVTGVSTIAGWFPDKKGFATGLVVMGFGIGALLMSKVLAPFALEHAGGSLPGAFLTLGAMFALVTPLAARGLASPPAPAANAVNAPLPEPARRTLPTLWGICFLYSLAGLGIISLQSPLMQKIAGDADASLSPTALAALGASLIGWTSLANSGGRLFWASISDMIGRVNTFLALLLSQAAVFLILPSVESPTIFGVLLAYTIACYGGAFGTIPSLIGDIYGAKRMSAVHGRVLTGWALAGLIAPTAFGFLKDEFPEQAAGYAFYTCALVLLPAAGLAFTLTKRRNRNTDTDFDAVPATE